MIVREPWVGSAFSGLLIIGESHYGTSDDADDVELTKRVIKLITEGTRHRFHTKVQQMIYGERGSEDPAVFWSQVSFLNFCPGVTNDPRHRPDVQMWSAGHDALPGLLQSISPTHILVLGAETWTNMPPFDRTAEPLTHEGRLREIGCYRVGEQSLAPATSVPHPSSWGFSTTKWHPFVVAFLERSGATIKLSP